MSNNNDIVLNLLILGKTGSGKSSLLNSLVGKKVEKTGTGKPVTKKGIFPHKETIDGKQIVIYDSWGIEVKKDKEWEEIVKKSLEEHGVDKDVKDWFHNITYCIQAGGGRIEDFDTKMIKLFLNEKYNVTVVVTKADQISSDKAEEEFINIIKKETGAETVIGVAAAPEPSRGQEKAIDPFGLEKYKKSILISWRKIFIDRMPLHIIKNLKKDIENKSNEYRNKSFSEKDLDVLSKKIQKEFEEFVKSKAENYLKENIKRYYEITKEINDINTNLNINIKDKSISSSGYYSLLGDMFSDLDFYDLESSIASILSILIGSPLLIVGGILDLFGFTAYSITWKKDAINSFIYNLEKNIIDEIDKKEFEEKLRNAIEQSLKNVEEKAIKK